MSYEEEPSCGTCHYCGFKGGFWCLHPKHHLPIKDVTRKCKDFLDQYDKATWPREERVKV